MNRGYNTQFGCDKARLENALRSFSSTDFFTVFIKLPISLEARMIRNEHEREIIRLIGNKNHSIDLFRDSSVKPGDLGASCNPKGENVSIDTLNLQFREYDDQFTDRGIVWVSPEDPARAILIITARAFAEIGIVANIITEAETAVSDKILRYFIQ